LRLDFKNDSLPVVVSTNSKAHTCQEIDNKSNRIPLEIKLKVEEYIDLGLTPSIVHDKLINMGMNLTLKQTQNLAKRHKEKKFGRNFQDFGEMENFLMQHENVPTDDLQAFVPSRQINVPNFLFVITSKTLLQNLKFANTHCLCDGTYKVMNEKYPVLVVGVTDKSRQFHPIAIAVSSNERCQEYAFLFSSLRETAESVLQCTFEPEKLVSDAADAIRNGYLEAFPVKSIDDSLTCYYHVRDAVLKKVSFLKIQ
jgi:hypothetical protein